MFRPLINIGLNGRQFGVIFHHVSILFWHQEPPFLGLSNVISGCLDLRSVLAWLNVNLESFSATFQSFFYTKNSLFWLWVTSFLNVWTKTPHLLLSGTSFWMGFLTKRKTIFVPFTPRFNDELRHEEPPFLDLWSILAWMNVNLKSFSATFQSFFYTKNSIFGFG